MKSHDCHVTDTADGIAKDLLSAGLLEGKERIVGTSLLICYTN